MLKILSFAALATAITLAGFAQNQTVNVKVAPITGTPATDGKQMFINYCAPCHGVNGRGNGPVASSLREQPADLALLARNHGGKYPFLHVNSVLESGTTNSAHGTPAMPVWGPVFSEVDPPTMRKAQRTLRINSVNRYIESIQMQ